MNIDAKLVKTLRDKTGAGMMDCKKALVESEGDLEKAVDHLRKSGIAKAEKKVLAIPEMAWSIPTFMPVADWAFLLS